MTKVREAQRALSVYLPRTPLIESPAVSELLGTRAFLKLETASPVSSFKGRGALFATTEWLKTARPAGNRLHVVTASSGNHGFAVAYAARILGVRATVFVHETAGEAKVRNIQREGARLIQVGHDFDAAKVEARKHAEEYGGWWLEDGEDPNVTIATATIGAEILADLPEVDVIFVPVGNGALIGGLASAARALKPSVTITGVQPEKAQAMVRSFFARKPICTESCETIADGLASRIPIPEAVRLMCEAVNQMLEVSEEEIVSALRYLVEDAHILAEPSAAVALAGALKGRDRLRGRRVVLVITGANIDRPALLQCLGSMRPVTIDFRAL